MATQQTVASITGTIQKYFERAWMEGPEEEVRTPLANSSVLEEATVPPNSGQYAEFRIFDKMTIPTLTAVDGSGGDTPKTYGENAEPTAANTLTAAVYQVSFEMLADFVYLGNVQVATDPIDLTKKHKDKFFELIRRMTHQLTNDRFVRPITANVLNASVVPTPLPAPFKTIYAGGAQAFGDLVATSYFRGADFKRARMLLANAGVPRAVAGKYAAFVSEAVLAELQEDPVFQDAVKRHEDLLRKSMADGGYVDWEGMRFILQDDGYRCNLPGSSGVLTTRANAGKVHVAHILGAGAAGYVDFGKPGTVARRTLRPEFKVQDISATGTGPTIGWRMAYQACVKQQKRGINVAGTSRFDESTETI